MEVYTNPKNTSTLKLIIAALIAKKKVEIKSATFNDDIFSGPRQLPLLVANGVKFFGNAAVHYLIPSSTPLETGHCHQLLEWEATRLQPAVFTVLNGKVASDLKQLLQSLLQTIDQSVADGKSLVNSKLSAADISIWSTIYPLYYNGDLKQQYLSEHSNLIRWFEDMASNVHIQEAVKQWDGNAEGPFGAISALGVPQIASLVSPIGSPDEGSLTEAAVTSEEIEAAKENWKSGKEKLLPPIKHEGVVLPVKGRKNILVTSALPYVNNVPHLGNIIGCVLSADIFVRYCKICGYNPLYISGTDEYGTATETKALEEGLSPRQICDKYYAIHSDVYKWFNIEFDYFGRTSTKEQTEICQQMFLELNKSGFVTAQAVEQLLCEKCDRFLADRFVEGTCPHVGCGYEDARGDQCDKCGKLIVAVELISPRCKVCGHTPVLRPSEQLFIELSQLETSIRTWVSSTEAGWSPSARAVARSWLREPLRARAVTRDLKWGVPVPIDKFKHKVFYVWFDAPIGYMSITQCATQRYEQWWLENKDYNVSLYQFMAKDNVPFHAIMFPATLIGVNRKHILVKHLYATEYLNYEDGKFSKSRGVGVFGTDARDTGIPSDVWRFYLASIRPETSDSSFSWVELGTRNNSELLNNLGNFCHRSLSFCANSFKGIVPELKLTQADYEVIALVNREIVAYVQHMEKGRLREALRHVLSISRLGNQHMQSQQPWVLLKGSAEDKERGTTAIGLCCQLAALLCTLISPYMPDTSARLRKQLCLNRDDLRIDPGNPSFIQYLPPGHTIGKPEPLFSKLEPEKLEALKAQYAGTQSERADKLNGASKTSSNPSVAELEAAIVEQGNKVRQLKSSTKDKTVWQPEVDKLLSLKKQLTSAQQATPAGDTSSDSVADLEKKIAEQGDKVRKLKASTKDKSVWQPEVNVLLDLKKRLAGLQLK